MAGGAFSFSGSSATSASVVSSSAAIELAFCKAKRTTLVGSITPAFTRSEYSAFSASKPKLGVLSALTRSATMAPLVTGVLRDLPQGVLQGTFHDVHAGLLVAAQLELI